MHIEFNDRLIWLLLGAAGVIAERVRKASARAAKPREEAERDGDQEERARRVREEVARKIAERNRREAPPRRASPLASGWSLPKPAAPKREPAPAPVWTRAEERRQEVPSAVQDFRPSQPEPQRAAVVVPLAPAVPANALGGSEDAGATTGAYTAAASIPAPILGGPAVARRSDLIADLRSPSSARRAILLREIIGPPVGLR